jgi:hypothetical protein
MGNIKFEIFPVYPWQFAILEIESKKKRKRSREGRVSGRAFCFYSEIDNSRETGYGHDEEES